MKLTASEEVLIALLSAMFVIAYALPDVQVWMGFR
jgi:hypothetical protein